MDKEPDVIHHEIDETRQSLTEKLETLEGQVKDTVAGVSATVEQTIETVKSSVEGTVENVKATVQDTVETVRRTFDIPHQVQQHPWLMTGGALLAGMAAGYVFSGRREGDHFWEPLSSRGAPLTGLAAGYQPEPRYQSSPAQSERTEEAKPGMLSSLLGPFEAEIDKLKGVAIGALLGLMRDTIKNALPPSLAANVTEIINDVTRKAGGQPLAEPVLPTEGTQASAARRPTSYSN